MGLHRQRRRPRRRGHLLCQHQPAKGRGSFGALVARGDDTGGGLAARGGADRRVRVFDRRSDGEVRRSQCATPKQGHSASAGRRRCCSIYISIHIYIYIYTCSLGAPKTWSESQTSQTRSQRWQEPYSATAPFAQFAPLPPRPAHIPTFRESPPFCPQGNHYLTPPSNLKDAFVALWGGYM